MTWQSTHPHMWQMGTFMIGLIGMGMAVGVALLLIDGSAGLVLAAAVAFVTLVVLTTVLVRLGLVAHTRRTANTRTRSHRATLTTLEPRQISTPHGEVLQGWAVPLANTDSYELVLTSSGYHMVNAQGQTVHRLTPTP